MIKNLCCNFLTFRDIKSDFFFAKLICISLRLKRWNNFVFSTRIIIKRPTQQPVCANFGVEFVFVIKKIFSWRVHTEWNFLLICMSAWTPPGFSYFCIFLPHTPVSLSNFKEGCNRLCNFRFFFVIDVVAKTVCTKQYSHSDN